MKKSVLFLISLFLISCQDHSGKSEYYNRDVRLKYEQMNFNYIYNLKRDSLLKYLNDCNARNAHAGDLIDCYVNYYNLIKCEGDYFEVLIFPKLWKNDSINYRRGYYLITPNSIYQVNFEKIQLGEVDGKSSL